MTTEEESARAGKAIELVRILIAVWRATGPELAEITGLGHRVVSQLAEGSATGISVAELRALTAAATVITNRVEQLAATLEDLPQAYMASELAIISYDDPADVIDYTGPVDRREALINEIAKRSIASSYGNVRLVPFDRDSYEHFRDDKADTNQLRSQWAAMQRTM